MLQDQDRQDVRTEVIVEPTMASRAEALQAKITFRQDRMYFLSPFKLAVVQSLPAYILGEEDRGLCIYRLATTIERDPKPHHHTPKPQELLHPPY